MSPGVPSRFVAGDGVRLAVREWPATGEPEGAVLLLHGLASTSHIFDLVAPRLSRRLRVVTYDQRGHGESGKPSSGYGFDRLVADAVAVMRARRLRRPVIVGHSWGANVALEAGVRRPRSVAGAVLMDGGFMTLRHRMGWAEARERLSPPSLAGARLDAFLGMARDFAGADGVAWTPEVEAVVRSLVRVDRRGYIHPRLSRRNHLRILRALWEQDALGLLRRILVPTLVLAARRAEPSGREAGFMEAKRRGARDVRAIGDPVRFSWIEGIHDVPLERPDAVARRIAAFARRIAQDHAREPTRR